MKTGRVDGIKKGGNSMPQEPVRFTSKVKY